MARLGEPEQAGADLTAALDLAAPVGHRIGLVRIRGVRARFRPERGDLDCVRDLDERLHAAAATA
ncbi:MAG: hypothetical protein ACRD0K_06060 [Egibacteraceae bacterium]